MATAVVSGRVDDGIRQKAEVAMRNAGLTPTDVIQNTWALIAEAGEVPEVLRPCENDGRGRAGIERLEGFLSSLPPVNPVYADWDDDDILALKVRAHA